jgi:hypothetical protein
MLQILIKILLTVFFWTFICLKAEEPILEQKLSERKMLAAFENDFWAFYDNLSEKYSTTLKKQV